LGKKMSSQKNQENLLQAGGRLLNRYKVISEIGSGPTGTVFKAVDLALDLPVAIKVFRENLFSGNNREINLLRLYRARAYQHETLVRIQEFQEEGKRFFLTCNLMDGFTLRQLIDFHRETGEYFIFSKIKSFTLRMIEGLKFIHKLGIHGNLKPENVFILTERLMLSDPFYLLGQEKLPDGEIPVSDYYRPPEQFISPEAERRETDIFSFLLILGELISCNPVQPSIKLSEQVPLLTSHLDDVFLKATDADHQKRYSSIEEMAHEIEKSFLKIEAEGLWIKKFHVTGHYRVTLSKLEEMQPQAVVQAPKPEEVKKEIIEEKEVKKPEKIKIRIEEKVKTHEIPVEKKKPEPVPVEEPVPSAEVIKEKPVEPETAKIEEQIPELVPIEAPEPEKEIEDETRKETLAIEVKELKDACKEDIEMTLQMEAPPVHAEIAEEEAVEVTEAETSEIIEEVADEVVEIKEHEEGIEIETEEKTIEVKSELFKEETGEEIISGGEPVSGETVQMFAEESHEPSEAHEDEILEVSESDIVLPEEHEEALVIEEAPDIEGKVIPEAAEKKEEIKPPLPVKPKLKEETPLASIIVPLIGVVVLVVAIVLAVVIPTKDNVTENTGKLEKDTVQKTAAPDIAAGKAADAVTAPKEVTAVVVPDVIVQKDAVQEIKPEVVIDTVAAADLKAVDIASGMISAAGLKCSDGMKKIVLKQEAPAGTKPAQMAYCIDSGEYPGIGMMPKTNVAMSDAAALCKKAGKRLCSGTEWTKACGGNFPYGDSFREGVCNTASPDGTEKPILASGSSKGCVSSYGVYDMSGNVSEWTSNSTTNGGDAGRSGSQSSCKSSPKKFPTSRSSYLGFRCCADSKSE
jgi:serine/threonine protein kinase